MLAHTAYSAIASIHFFARQVKTNSCSFMILSLLVSFHKIFKNLNFHCLLFRFETFKYASAYSVFISICQHMLNVRKHNASSCSVFTSIMLAHSQCSLELCQRILSVCKHYATACSVFASTMLAHTQCLRKQNSGSLKFAKICSLFACIVLAHTEHLLALRQRSVSIPSIVLAYAEHPLAQCQHLLSIRQHSACLC